MKDRTRRTARTAAATLAAGALTLGVVIPATAQDGSDADAPTAEAAPDRTARHEARHAAFAAALADELGLDTETVADAIDSVRDQLATEHRAGVGPGHRAEGRAGHGPAGHGDGRGPGLGRPGATDATTAPA